MVTDATSTSEAEAPPVVEDDQPLIPQAKDPDLLIQPEVAEPETEEKPEGAGESEAGGTEAEAEGAAEPEEAEAPKETAEEKAARLYSEDEFKKLQSRLDAQVAEERRLRQEAEQRAQQEAARNSQQAFEAEVVAVYQRIKDEYIDLGMDDQMADKRAQSDTLAHVRAFQEHQKSQQLQQQLDEIKAQNERTSSSVVAREMAQKYGVSDEDIPLLASKTPAEMEPLAKRLGQLTKQSQQLAEARRAEVPNGGESASYDSNEGASGMTDDQKLSDMNTPIEVIEEILAKRGQHPFR